MVTNVLKNTLASSRFSSTSPALPAAPTASSASYDFSGPVAPESIVVTFGSNLASATALTTKAQWDTTLGGLTVTVKDSLNVSRVAPLYYVSPTQVMYLIPKGTAAGTARSWRITLHPWRAISALASDLL